MDLFDKAYRYTEPAQVTRQGLYPYFIPFASRMGPVAEVEDRHVLMFGSNNYLGLTDHPQVVSAAHDALEQYGTSCTGSRFVNGSLNLHRDLETDLATFFGKEAALVFTTGCQTNLGSIAAAGDPRAHASIRRAAPR